MDRPTARNDFARFTVRWEAPLVRGQTHKHTHTSTPSGARAHSHTPRTHINNTRVGSCAECAAVQCEWEARSPPHCVFVRARMCLCVFEAHTSAREYVSNLCRLHAIGNKSKCVKKPEINQSLFASVCVFSYGRIDWPGNSWRTRAHVHAPLVTLALLILAWPTAAVEDD